MNAEDDDLPVLTHILRTGNAGLADAVTPTPAMRHADALDPRTVDDATWLSDPLVIGQEFPDPTHRPVGNELSLSFDVTSPQVPPSGQDDDPAVSPVTDVFALSQDHDAPQALGIAYDEPEYSIEPPTETPRHDPTALAERVREAVLETLGARIDVELDARIAQAIHVEVETALGQLQAQLRTHLAEALKDVVGRAVDEEIARLSVLRAVDGA